MGCGVGIAILAGILACGYWFLSSRRPDAFFNAGKKYYDQKKYPEAIIQFLNAVDRDPQNRDSRYYLALSFLHHHEPAPAAEQLKSLLEAYPDDVDATLQLGDLYLSFGGTNPQSFIQAKELAEKILSKNPQNIDALILSGNAATGLRDFNESAEQLERAISLDPENNGAYLSLGTSRTLQKNYPEAEKAFLKAREANPKDIATLISLGNYYRALGATEKAEAVFTEAVSLYPANKLVYSQAVEFYFQAGKLEAIEKVLKNAQAVSTDDPSPTLMLAGFYEKAHRAQDARKLLMDLKAKFPRNIDVLVAVAENLIPDKQDQVRPAIDQLLSIAPKDPIGYVLLGELEFRMGQFDAAEATLGKDPALNSPFPQVHYLLGNVLARKGRLDQALDHYRKALVLNSQYLPARLAMADAYRAKGNLVDAREEDQKALKEQPDSVPALLLKATLDVADKNYAQAEKELSTLAQEHPSSAAIQRQLGLYYDVRGKGADAEKSLIRAVELSPNSEQSLRELTIFYMRTGHADRALQRLNGIPDGQKQAFQYELTGMAAAQQGQTADAEKAFKKALEKDPNRTSCVTLIFNLYVQAGRMEDALKELDSFSRKNPSNGGVYAMRGTILEGQGKIKDAEQNYSQALQLDPNIDFAANNLAYLLAQEGRELETALGLAQNVQKRQPQDPNTADTLGWVYYKMRSYLLARAQAEFAVSKQPGNGLFEYHLGMIYKANNQMREASSAFNKAIASRENFNEKPLAQSALKEIQN